MNLGDPDDRAWQAQLHQGWKTQFHQGVGDAHSSDDSWDNITHGERRGIAVVNAFEERSIV